MWARKVVIYCLGLNLCRFNDFDMKSACGMDCVVGKGGTLCYLNSD